MPRSSLYDPVQIADAHWRYEVYLGTSIGPTIAEAIRCTPLSDGLIEFEFNGVTVRVKADSNPELIYRDWSRALSGYIEKVVGPYPNPVLTDEEKANDARIEAENERRRQEHDAQRQEEQRRHDLMLEGALSAAPEKMTIRDEEAYRQAVEMNSDGYGAGIIRYAERWARLMEARLAHGDTLEACAEEASHLADNEGITGAMYGFAVSFLSKVWIHGEELRRWHNRTAQLQDEGDKANEEGSVLNPAFIRVG